MSGRNAAGSSESARIDLVGRFDRHLRSSRLLSEGSSITIALSGGLDSVALLDLLASLQGPWGWRLSAAHFDHRMREESGEEAEWVRALCTKASLPVVVGRAPVAPDSEAEARELRYRFLYRARSELRSDWLATAHQADDQAETVLFRLLRGSGLPGLAGIPARRAPHTVRPLLPFWRAELEAYVRARSLSYLTDPTNRDARITRNWIRHQLIPAIETSEVPDLRRQLVRLSDLARRAGGVVGQMTERAADELVLEAAENRIVVARTRFLAYDTNVRAHLLRALVARVGPQPGRVGTRVALEFINTCSSGRSLDLAGGVVVRREFDRLAIEREAYRASASDHALAVPDRRSGEAEVMIAGVSWRVRWAPWALEGETLDSEQVVCFDPSELQFPLTVRSWRPGDRIRLHGGTRKLKKVFADSDIARSQRGRYPLLADQLGVLWIVGLLKGVRASSRDGGEVFSVSVRRAG